MGIKSLRRKAFRASQIVFIYTHEMMIKNVSLLSALLLLVTQSNSFGSDACSSLSSFSCQPGKYDDGTGTVFLPIEESNAKLASKYHEVAKPAIKKHITENTKFRKNLIEALGSDLSSCQSEERTQVEKCNSGLSERVAGFISADTIEGEYAENIDYMKLYDVINGPEFRAVAKRGLDGVGKAYSLDKKTRQIKTEMIPSIKKIFENKISEMNIDSQTKAKIVRQIQRLNFKGTDCSLFDDAPFDVSTALDEIYIYDGIYTQDWGLVICKGLLTEGYSQFAVAHLIAREIARTIDPCGLAGADLPYSKAKDAAFFYKQYPFNELVTCLRNPKSANAQTRVKPQANERTPLDIACEYDPMGQAFTDWFAAETTTEYMSHKHPQLTSQQWQKGIANIFRANCETEPEEGDANNSGLRERFDKILAANPVLRQRMGCANPSAVLYCDGNNVENSSSNFSPRPQPRPGNH